jgi:hypothetical protein
LDRAIRKHAFNAHDLFGASPTEDAVNYRGMPHREATVHFAMGKVYKRLGQTEQAMLLTAMDLDPRKIN